MREIVIQGVDLRESRRGAVLGFRRRVPSATQGLELSGLHVDVFVHPDLQVRVRGVTDRRLLMTGLARSGGVAWDLLPSAGLPRTAMDMIAADVADMLFVFERRLIDPRSWTSDPHALATL